MKRSYVQNESFENNFFQYIFAQWDFRTVNRTVVARRVKRFKAEIQNIHFERKDKTNFVFERAMEKILFKIKRLGLWVLTLFIFGGAVTAVYFANEFTFQVDFSMKNKKRIRFPFVSFRNEQNEKNRNHWVNKNLMNSKVER